MKKLLKLTGLFAGLGAALWLMRDRLISVALPREPEPPTFRVGPGPELPQTGDDLTRIDGIGPVFSARLHQAGVTTFGRLAAQDPTELAEQVGATPTQVESWIDQAAELQASN